MKTSSHSKVRATGFLKMHADLFVRNKGLWSILLSCPLAFVLSSCGEVQQNQCALARDEISKADKTMGEIAIKEGFYKSLLQYAADSLIKFEDDSYPIIGRKNLEADWNDREDTKAITWASTKVDASSDGTMGYSVGDWKMQLPDTTYYGVYITVWKKQSDGSWKWVVDAGSNTPGDKR